MDWKNNTLSNPGFRTWEKKVKYWSKKIDGLKVHSPTLMALKISWGEHPDNETFTWVAANSRGYNMGRILEKIG